MKKIALAALMLVAAGSAAMAQDAAGAPRQHPGGFLAQVDTNGDGEIDIKEFTAAATKRAGDQFDKIDIAKKGLITRDQFIAARQADAKSRFEQMDTNKDGKLTKEDRPQHPDGKHLDKGRIPPPPPEE
jgi:Ca2+-binding EF-hand superfamily protein